MPSSQPQRITSVEQLEALYGAPSERALIKEIDHISDHYRAFIEASPFVIVGSAGPEGLDCSPRGDPAGFVRVADPKTVLIPDRRGNNRADTLRNILRDARISLLFLIPGIGETLRINGQAEILVEPKLLDSFAVDGKKPRSVISTTVDTVYFQCQKALVRSRLWDPEARRDRGALPSAGDILQALSGGSFDGKSYDASYGDYIKETIY
ncbi:MAG: pyridoxamine 5'-phosphate oxidase family protein [Alphaproteobacteria bacterium]